MLSRILATDSSEKNEKRRKKRERRQTPECDISRLTELDLDLLLLSSELGVLPLEVIVLGIVE